MRKIVSSGGPWEDVIGYSRAVRSGPGVWVAGTTATVDGTVVGVGDPHEQARVAFGIALAAVRTAGLDLKDVVRTRMYVIDITHLDEIGRAHLEAFGDVRPAATMVQVVGLAHPDHLVEVEVEAYLAPLTWRERLDA